MLPPRRGRALTSTDRTARSACAGSDRCATPACACLELEPGGGRDHGRGAGIDCVDDLAVVDALEIDACDGQVVVAELALDDHQGNAFACHLDGVGVTQLVRREAASHAGLSSQPAKLRADRRCRARAAGGRSVDDAEQGPGREGRTILKPGAQLLPAPGVHANGPALAALATAHQDAPAL